MARASWKRLCAASLLIATACASVISSDTQLQAPVNPQFQAPVDPQYQAALPDGRPTFTNPSIKPSPPKQVETKPAPPSDPKAGLVRPSLWRPAVGATWQIALRNPINMKQPKLEPDVEVWDIDAYENSKEIIQEIQKRGKKVLCYFSAGTYENYREDKGLFHPSDLGKTLDGWPDERWIKLSSKNVRSIMAKRIKTAASKGCDALDPDNVDGYANDNGLGLTQEDTVDFIKFLSTEARGYNMSIGLKNAGAVIDRVMDVVDFAVNEQCVQYSECTVFSKFIQAGKPVFHIEYPAGAPWINAPAANSIFSRRGKSRGSDKFSTIVKKMNLDGWVRFWDGSIYNTVLGR